MAQPELQQIFLCHQNNILNSLESELTFKLS